MRLRAFQLFIRVYVNEVAGAGAGAANAYALAVAEVASLQELAANERIRGSEVTRRCCASASLYK